MCRSRDKQTGREAETTLQKLTSSNIAKYGGLFAGLAAVRRHHSLQQIRRRDSGLLLQSIVLR